MMGAGGQKDFDSFFNLAQIDSFSSRSSLPFMCARASIFSLKQHLFAPCIAKNLGGSLSEKHSLTLLIEHLILSL
jgi:hypothetical protein